MGKRTREYRSSGEFRNREQDLHDPTEREKRRNTEWHSYGNKHGKKCCVKRRRDKGRKKNASRNERQVE